jgi:hypothetical protein
VVGVDGEIHGRGHADVPVRYPRVGIPVRTLWEAAGRLEKAR